MSCHILFRLLLLTAHNHIKHDRSDDDSALDDRLQIGADADHVHAVIDKADDEDTKYAARDGSNAACEGSAAKNGCCDCIGLICNTEVGLSGLDLGRIDHCCKSRQGNRR